MSPFYTRSGDAGDTGLLGEGRVAKFDLRIEALGAVDEATAALGVARAFSASASTRSLLVQTQKHLYQLMAEVAATPQNAGRFRGITPAEVAWLEAETDRIEAAVSLPKEFILPGENQASAMLALARTLVRRAERRVVELHHIGGLENISLLAYLNRLSSLCFVLELQENQQHGTQTQLAKE